MTDEGIDLGGINQLMSYLDKVEDSFTDSQMMRVTLECGNRIMSKAVDKAPVDTGNLRRSIQVRQDEDTGEGATVTVGVHEDTAVSADADYAVYIEYGTGIYAENGNGRKTPWKWQGTGKKWGAGQDKSAWHTTRGMRARPFMRPAFEESIEDCMKIIDKRMDQILNGGAY